MKTPDGTKKQHTKQSEYKADLHFIGSVDNLTNHRIH